MNEEEQIAQGAAKAADSLPALPTKAAEAARERALGGTLPRTPEKTDSLTQRWQEKQPRETEAGNLVPAKGFSKSEFSTIPLKEGELDEFFLNAETDRQLYDLLSYIKKCVDALPDDPNTERLRRMINERFPILKARADQIAKMKEKGAKKEEKYKGNERIFHPSATDKEGSDLMFALYVLETNQIYLQEALGVLVTNNGEWPANLNIPSGEELDITLREAMPALGTRVREPIRKAFTTLGGRLMNAAWYSSFGVVAGRMLGEKLGGGDPRSTAIASIAGAVLGAASGYCSSFEFVAGREADKISLRFLPTESRVITAYAEQLGILSNIEEAAGFFSKAELLRYQILESAGVDLSPEGQLVIADLSPDNIDPASNTIGRGASTFRFYNERSQALKELLQGRSLADLSPEERMKLMVQASDTAISRVCEKTAVQIADELTRERGEVIRSSAGQIETSAKEVSEGKRSLSEITKGEVEAAKKEEGEATQKQEDFERLKHELDAALEEIKPLQVELDNATAARKTLKSNYETAGATGKTHLEALETEINTLLDAINNPDTGLINERATASAQLRSLENRKRAIIREIEELKAEREGIAVDISHPTESDPDEATKRRNYTPDEVKSEHQRIGQAIRILENNQETLDGEITSLRAKENQLGEQINTARADAVRLREEVKRIRDKIEEADTNLTAATTKIAPHIAERDRILQEMANLLTPPKPGKQPPTTLSQEEVSGRLLTLRREALELTEARTELENKLALFKEGKGEATEADKRTAEGLQRIAALCKEQKFNETVAAIILQRGLLNELADPSFEGYKRWLTLFFGPNALAVGQMKDNQLILSQADIIMAAADFFDLSDRFFGRNETGQFKMAVVKERMTQISSLQEEIAQKQRLGKSTRSLEVQLRKLRQENHGDLSAMYGQVAYLFGADRFRTAGLAMEIIDRLRIQGLRIDPFSEQGATYERPMPKKTTREIGPQYIGEYGSIGLEPTHLIGGTPQDYGSIRYTTSMPRFPGARIRMETVIHGPAGESKSLRGQITIQLNRAFWQAMPDKKPAQGLPPELAVLYDNADNKKEFKDIEAKAVQINLEGINGNGLLNQLGSMSSLGNLHQFYPRALGEMLAYLSNEEREKYFKGFTDFRNVRLFVNVNGTDYRVYRDPTDGQIKVHGGHSSSVTDESLADFLNSVKASPDWTSHDVAQLLENAGIQALQALQVI